MLAAVDGGLIASEFLHERVQAYGDLAREELGRALNSWRRAHTSLGPASSVRAILDVAAAPILELLGFGRPTDVETLDSVGGPTLLAATVHAGPTPVALLVGPWAHRLHAIWRLAVRQALRRSARWCIAVNGTSLRVVDAGHPLAHAFIEFDLAICCDDPLSLAALRLTAGAAALEGDGPHSLTALVTESERHAVGVCRSLRDGVLQGSEAILGALVAQSRDVPVDGAFDQALTIVYRVLFLLFAEARALVPLWHPVYKRSYSIDALREAAEHPTPAAGLWDGLRAIARLAHTGCIAGDLRVTPFNGRLFAPARTPLAESRHLDDEAARQAILRLSTRSSAGGRRRIAYRDLGVEQLGAVYETVLDYQPRIERAPAARGRRARPVVTLEPGSGTRKSTGTFYTPQSIADYVVRQTLGPLVRDTAPDAILSLRIVDPAMGSGAFLVAACRFLAAEYEQALIRTGRCNPSDIDEPQRALIRRRIAERCLYGVDINPMAVQLARLSMWLATLAADRPLSFLDHRLQVGDSIVGAWLRQLRCAPQKRRTASALPLLDDHDPAHALQDALPVRFSLETTPNDTLQQVRDKERAFAAMTSAAGALARWKHIADLWCASWFDGEAVPAAAFTALTDAVLRGRGALGDAAVERYLEAASRIAVTRRFFHWELEFPEVFFGADGQRLPRAGFDAVIGNPPWDMMRADAGSSDARARARTDNAPVLRFTRDAGVYRAQSSGHANRYQLFVERAVDLTRSGGRIGLVLPSGLATDSGSAGLRRLLFSRCGIDTIVGVDNHRGVFPIHRSVRFLLVTASAGSSTERFTCRLGLDDPAQLTKLDSEPTDGCGVSLSPALLDRISGQDLTIPALATPVDLAIVERTAALFPPLGSAEGWGATFGRELNATDDRDILRRADARGRGGMSVVHGKHLDAFTVRTDDVLETVLVGDARRRLRSDAFMRPRLAYRDVASATNRMTLIAAVLPGGCVSTHTVFCLRTPLASASQHFLCGVFNSFVANYLVRLRVTTHVTTATIERLPVPTPRTHPRAVREIAAVARLLARRHDPEAFALLNARVATLYQLSPDEFRHVLATFPLIERAERDRAFDAFVRTR